MVIGPPPFLMPAVRQSWIQAGVDLEGPYNTAQFTARVIEAKVDGRETVEVEEAEPEGKLIDLMAALEASVSAATASRKEPVSVSEAKAARAKREEKGEKAKPAARRTAAKAKSDEDEESAASGSRRKRKSA